MMTLATHPAPLAIQGGHPARPLAACGKPTAARFEALKDRIKILHPYDLPEIIAVPITQGDEAYLKWITENTK